MSTRSIGDLNDPEGPTSSEDPITPLAPHADVRTNDSSDSKNELNELGQKIFLDRYAMKDMPKRTLSVGDLVIVCVDDKTGQREIGHVRAMEAGRVSVELRDGLVVERLIEHIAKPIETDPEQMMERVARGIAAVEGERAEEWYHRFKWLLQGWKFVPAGRILTAAGTDQQLTFYNCMPPEQEVLTAGGYKPIAEVCVGDLVVTHRNRLRRVLHKFERETQEPLYIIKAKKLGYDDLRVTGEHKILAIRSEWVNTHKSRDDLKLQSEPQWIPARELKPGDYIAAAYDGKERPSTSICISGYVEYDELWWIEIESIRLTNYSGRVLDLEVDEDHSFVSAGLVVSNCYVVPSPKDSRRGIVDTLSHMMEIMSRGGGVGINVSSLRPRHSYVKGVNGRSSGSVSWGALYSFVTGLIEQGGSRRGALMLILNCWHPDVVEFINAKREMGKITNANVSVGITDKFMEAVHSDSDWDLVFADTSDPDYESAWDGNLDKWLAAGKKVVVHKTVKARDIWNSIIESAWTSAEPGVFFIERANKMSNSWYYDTGYLGCTNPCGEQPIPGWAVCNLGAINLSKFVRDGEVDWESLGTTVRYAVRFLDDVIDATPYFFDENYAQQKSERRVGLNTMGLAEMLIRLGIRYGSDESVQFIDRLYRFISSEAYLASTDIAAEKEPFPLFDAEKFLQSGYMQTMPDDVRAAVREKGARNVTLLTQAPNGTIGTMVGTSTGIEPFYFWNYFRRSRLGKHEERVKVLEEWQQSHPGEPTPGYFVTAMDLAPEEHVKVQAAIQRWVDSSISKTCNLPASYTVDQTREIYEMLYRLGCKGGTIYRDGSRDVQVLNLKEEDTKSSAAPSESAAPPQATATVPPQIVADTVKAAAVAASGTSSSDLVQSDGGLQPKVRPRPYKRRGYTVSKTTPSGTAHITMNEDEEEQPFEVFLEIGKAGSDIKAMAEAMGRLMSLILRMASPVSPVERVGEIVKQITGIGGARSYGFGKRRVLSLPDAVGQALAENYLGVSYGNEQDGQGSEMGMEATSPSGAAGHKASAIAATSADLCPRCGDSAFVRVEGCQTCYACGYSEC
jgi:ribonucleoside-diphosphate reductase alpha chain